MVWSKSNLYTQVCLLMSSSKKPVLAGFDCLMNFPTQSSKVINHHRCLFTVFCTQQTIISHCACYTGSSGSINTTLLQTIKEMGSEVLQFSAIMQQDPSWILHLLKTICATTSFTLSAVGRGALWPTSQKS